MSLIRLASLSDALIVGQHLSRGDRAELAVSFPEYSPAQAIAVSIANSALCWTALWNGTPAVVFGACPTITEGCGLVWLLGDHRRRAYRRTFLRRSVEYVAQMQQKFPILYNYVWQKNRASLRWLEWLGFTRRDTVKDFRELGETFYLMAKGDGIDVCR